MSQELLAKIDVERRTTRGRACPRCGGKIIPSNRAVYGAANPDEAFPIWQCERCGYEEMGARKEPTAKKHAPAAATKATASTAQLPASRPKLRPAMLDAKGRSLPPDVMAIMSEFQKSETKDV
jgi:ribosomal protein L37AE/L43A